MKSMRHPSLLKRFRIFSRMLVYLSGAISLLALGGWIFGVPTLTTLVPDYASMKVSTAISVLMTSYCIWRKSVTRTRSRIVNIFATLQIIFAALTGIEYLFSINLPIDAYDPSNPNMQALFGRMAPTSAFNFFITGLAILLIDKNPRGYRKIAQSFFLLCGVIGGVAVIGYMYSARALYHFAPFASMALNTALCFVILSLSGLCLRPNLGFMQVFSSPMLGGSIARKTLPIAIITPVIMGWLRLWGERLGFYEMEIGLSLFCLANILVFSAVIWFNARLVDRVTRDRHIMMQINAASLLREGETARTLAISTGQYKALFQSVHDYAISGLDTHGNITSWNLGAEKILGYKEEEVRGKNVDLCYRPEERSTVGGPADALAQAALMGRFEGQTWHVRKDGNKFWANVVINAIYDQRGQIAGYAKITRDITTWKQQSDQLQDSEARLQSVMNNVIDGIISINERGLVESMNTAAVKLFGYEPKEVLGKNIKLLMPSPYKDEHDNYIKNYIATGVKKIIGIGREVIGSRKDGSTFPLELAVGEFQQKGQRYFTGVIRDITERKEVEKQISEQNRRHQEALESRVAERTEQLSATNATLHTTVHELKESREQLRLLSKRFHVIQEKERSRIATEIHDELGQMLAVMKLELIRMKNKLTKQPELVDQFKVLMERLDQTIVVLRRISADLKPIVLEQLGLAAALEWLASDISKRTGVKCNLNIESDSTEYTDEVATNLFRVIQEALTNALKYSDSKQIDIGISKIAGEMVFTVRDYGKGIPAETARRSTALGIVGMRERVLAIGGKIEIGNAEHGGTLVTVSLPAQGAH